MVWSESPSTILQTTLPFSLSYFRFSYPLLFSVSIFAFGLFILFPMFYRLLYIPCIFLEIRQRLFITKVCTSSTWNLLQIWKDSSLLYFQLLPFVFYFVKFTLFLILRYSVYFSQFLKITYRIYYVILLDKYKDILQKYKQISACIWSFQIYSKFKRKYFCFYFLCLSYFFSPFSPHFFLHYRKQFIIDKT